MELGGGCYIPCAEGNGVVERKSGMTAGSVGMV